MKNTIKTTGQWWREKWELNYSDILTRLIQDAGRYCDNYASDLFVIWKYCVEEKLLSANLESFTVIFGFYETGVEHECSYEPDRSPVTKQIKENRYYYRKVETLKVTIDGDNITMELEV